MKTQYKSTAGENTMQYPVKNLMVRSDMRLLGILNTHLKYNILLSSPNPLVPEVLDIAIFTVR